MQGDRAFSTLHLPASQRVAGWAEAASDRFVESSFKVLEPEAFIASMLNRDMADLSLTRVASVGHVTKRVSRSRQQAARAAEDFFLVSLQLDGSCALAQGSRETVLRPGEFAIYDTRRPYELVLHEDYQQVVMRIPRRTLAARLPHCDALVATSVGAHELPSRMLVQMVRTAYEAGAAPPAAVADDIADSVLGMVCAGLRTVQDGEALPRPRDRQLARVRAYIAQNLHDPGLGVARIAQALGLSTSYLHKLFRGEAHTLERSIWLQRLDACERALAGAGSAGRTITEIAYAAGFSDAAHFSRAFQQRFGMTPRAYRRRHGLAAQMLPIVHPEAA
jgi:AraC-like DNA-binding protein